MTARRPIRLYPCAKCAAMTVHPFYTQIAGIVLCGICAGALPGDPPQAQALRLDRDTMRVSRKANNGEWYPVDLPPHLALVPT